MQAKLIKRDQIRVTQQTKSSSSSKPVTPTSGIAALNDAVKERQSPTAQTARHSQARAAFNALFAD